MILICLWKSCHHLYFHHLYQSYHHLYTITIVNPLACHLDHQTPAIYLILLLFFLGLCTHKQSAHWNALKLYPLHYLVLHLKAYVQSKWLEIDYIHPGQMSSEHQARSLHYFKLMQFECIYLSSYTNKAKIPDISTIQLDNLLPTNEGEESIKRNLALESSDEVYATIGLSRHVGQEFSEAMSRK